MKIPMVPAGLMKPSQSGYIINVCLSGSNISSGINMYSLFITSVLHTGLF